MTKENNGENTTLTSIVQSHYGEELDTNNWICEFKNWKMELILDGLYYRFLDKAAIDCNVSQSPIFRESPIMWKVILRKNPQPNYFISALNNVNHSNSESDNTEEQREKDRGHFIADSFDKYLLTNDELNANKSQTNQFFGKNNKSNVSLQDSSANRNSKVYAGQLRFEQTVKDYFEKNTIEDAKVYYEIEEVKIEEKVLGRRLFIQYGENVNEYIHVFIPEYRDRTSCASF